MVVNKMVRTKWYTDKMVQTKWYTDKIGNETINPAPIDNMILNQSCFHFDPFRLPLCVYHLIVNFGC